MESKTFSRSSNNLRVKTVVEQRSQSVCDKIGFNPLDTPTCVGIGEDGQECRQHIPLQLREFAFYILGYGANLRPNTDEVWEILTAAAQQLYCYDGHKDQDKLVDQWLSSWRTSLRRRRRCSPIFTPEDLPKLERVPTPFHLPWQHPMRLWRYCTAWDAPELILSYPHQVQQEYVAALNAARTRASQPKQQKSNFAALGKALRRLVSKAESSTDTNNEGQSNTTASDTPPSSSSSGPDSHPVTPSDASTSDNPVHDGAPPWLTDCYRGPMIDCEICASRISSSNPHEMQKCPQCHHFIHMSCFEKWIGPRVSQLEDGRCPYCYDTNLILDPLMLLGPRPYAARLSQEHHDLYDKYIRQRRVNAECVEHLSAEGISSLDALRKKRILRLRLARDMLLIHQIGSVKVGEVVRYTLTYTPSLDRILPPPQHLHVKIKNTSAIPLRAAYLHGPYTLYTSCYPSTFDPNVKHVHVKTEGAPYYEPQLKAGGSWTAKLLVPETVRACAGERPQSGSEKRTSFTWVIEIASQVLFSTTAAVHYELLVGRDEKSVALGVTGVVSLGSGQGMPGKLEDVQSKRVELKAEVQTRGVFSKAIRLAVDDTQSLWNTPPFPSWDDEGNVSVKSGPEHGDKRDTEHKDDQKQRKQKKIHLVVLTHGLHSNLGADMLYVKESIDSAAKQAREDAKQKRAELRAKKLQQDNDFGRDASKLRSNSVPDIAIAPTPALDDADEEDEEQVLVRGFNGNAVKTEKGIQYLGKRLAKYVLSITYPDQPYLPVKSSISKSITRSLTGSKSNDPTSLKPTHKHSTIVKDVEHQNHNLAYRITSISFVAHSLGGLIQTYAIAYIQKHSPEFFDRIEPVNFVAMASPFLGLSNENPMYVKFALDFGLVGRTGQDLGLTWRAPTIARNGWGAMVNGLVNDPHKNNQPDPGSKPLLRILPTGPAHQALKRFRNRTVYSNVVNDGIVPLRTSCLLFLDWRGLGRVEKARRENGLIGTMVNWGWNEMTGQNASAVRKPLFDFFADENESTNKAAHDVGSDVPDARASQYLDSTERQGDHSENNTPRKRQSNASSADVTNEDTKEQQSNMWTGFLSWFRPQAGSKPDDSKSVSSAQSSKTPRRKRTPKIYQRGQIMSSDDSDTSSPERSTTTDTPSKKPRGPVRGSSLYTNNSAEENLEAPPKTTVFESAGDLLSPPLPTKEFLLDPAARPRTIFHDRVYHPEDIPMPPLKRPKTFLTFSSSRNTSKDVLDSTQAQGDLNSNSSSRAEPADNGTMKIEEKIARAYHKDMSWRKVLISMEPDAHNNMIVRRMFANAYGWPVVKHLCDTHFAFTASARTKDSEEATHERAKPANETVGSTGEQVVGQVDPPGDHVFEMDKTNLRESRSKSFDDKTTSQPASARASNQTVQSLVERVRTREKEKDNHHRTSSEIRESRDEVTDLVSMATATGTPSGSFSNSSHSASTALHRLARQDSARWSDRFFSGSENDSDDDDNDAYLEQLHRAKQRGDHNYLNNHEDEVFPVGQHHSHSQRKLSKDSSNSQHSPVTASSSLSYSSSTFQPVPRRHIQHNSSIPARLLTDSHQGIIAEPDSMSPIFSSSRKGSDAPTTNIMVDPQVLPPTGLGLGKVSSNEILKAVSENDRVEAADAASSGGGGGGGVVEQVARASAVVDVSASNSGDQSTSHSKSQKYESR